MNAVRLDERNGVIHNLLKESEKVKSDAQTTEKDHREALKDLEHQATLTRSELEASQSRTTAALEELSQSKIASSTEIGQLKSSFATAEKNLQASLDFFDSKIPYSCTKSFSNLDFINLRRIYTF